MARGTDPVSVLLSNRELLVGVFAVLIWLLKKLGVTGKKDAARPAAGGHLQTARTETADQVAERTRRVQEEVRRKIAERRAAAASPNFPPNFPPRKAPEENLPRRSSRSASEDGPPLMVPRAVEETEPDAEAIEFTRQQKLESQMLALDAARAAAARQAAAISSGATLPVGQLVGVADLPPPNPWLAELRDPGSVRRAILLREILGPPISLRRST